MNRLDRNARWFAPAVFAAIVVCQFGSLLWDKSRLVGSAIGDMRLYFFMCRAFGFEQIAAGNLPLWIPHSYGGEPFAGSFASALFYPPNWFLPFVNPVIGVNWSLAIHFFMAGYFTYLWARSRAISVIGSLIAGSVFMFSGPYFLHLFGGHLTHLCTMVWAPLLLCAIDGLSHERKWKWVLLGTLAVSMQILSGQPQYVYYTAMLVPVYVLVSLFRCEHRKSLLLGTAAMYVISASVTAVQLLTGMEAAGESIRGGEGMDFTFAASLSFPPLNWVTLIAPQWLGAIPDPSTPSSPIYWGFGSQWEASIFIGVAAVALVLMSLTSLKDRNRWPLFGLLMVSAVLAMGRFTPLYQVLFDHFPKFNAFRGTSKFAYLTTLALAVLAGHGFDAWLARPKLPKAVILAPAIIGAALLLLGRQIEQSGQSSNGAWSALLQRTVERGAEIEEIYTRSKATYADPRFIAATARRAADATRQAGLVLFTIGIVMTAAGYHRLAPYAILLVIAWEYRSFANESWAICTPTPMETPAEWQRAFDVLPADQRVLVTYFGAGDYTVWRDRNAVWGYDAHGLKRWAEFMFASQDLPPDKVSQYLDFYRAVPQFMQLTRCRFILNHSKNAPPVIETPNPMAVAQLIGSARVVPDRDTLLSSIGNPAFNPRQTVLLESDPSIAPAGQSQSGTVNVVRSGTDELEIEANVTSPSILLVTNAYSAGWRAKSIGPSPQEKYDVVPANWAFQGIPLRAGTHRILLYYLPTGFRVGRWVSLVSIVGLVAGAIYARRKRAAVEISAN